MTTSTVMKKLSVAAAGAACIALGTASFEAPPAQAAVLSAPLTVNVSSGSSTDGSVSWDTSFLAGIGAELLSPGNGLVGLNLTFLGNTYTEASDLRYAAFPRLLFSNGVLSGVDFLFQVVGTTDRIQLDYGSNQVFDGSSFATIGSYEAGSATAVPTPALLPGLIGLGMSIASLRKRQTATAKQA